MKINVYLLLICLFCFSCKSDPCEELDCGTHGTCNADTESCVCDQYYEGDLCETEVRARFLSTWSGTGECDYNPGNTSMVVINITAGVEVNEVMVQSPNILQEFTMSGMLDENNNILIPEFMAHIGSNLHDGTIVFNEDGSLLFTLNIYVDGEKNVCTYNLNK